MYVNLIKEVKENGKVIERKTVSFDLATTNMKTLGHFTRNGWVIVDYSDERRG